jgi:hypothetical protein
LFSIEAKGCNQQRKAASVPNVTGIPMASMRWWRFNVAPL